MAEVDRRSENFAAVALQRAAEAPQSWGLPRELRKASIALLSDIHRKEEEGFLAQMEQEQEQKMGRGSDSGAASTLAPPTPDPPVTAKQCYAIAETLAKHILARNRNKQPPLEPEPEPEPEPEDGEEEMSAEDLALQREQMAQNAADGNLDFADLADASCLPTLLKLMEIPQLT